MKPKKAYAYSKALAYESIPIDLMRSDIDSDVLEKYARTIAYKVFHNLQMGYPMDKKKDPVKVDGKPASKVWAEHYNQG